MGGRVSVLGVLYGLGTENQNLPGFVVLLQGGVRSGPEVYGEGFLPAAYQGTSFRPGGNPILNLKVPEGRTLEQQRDLLETLRTFNQSHLEARNHDSELAARLESYELAFPHADGSTRSDGPFWRIGSDQKDVRS